MAAVGFGLRRAALGAAPSRPAIREGCSAVISALARHSRCYHAAPARGRMHAGLAFGPRRSRWGNAPAWTRQLSQVAADPNPERFADQPLCASTLRALEQRLQLTEMTEIQAKTLQPALAGLDVLGRARTGTGKTVAFLVPAIEQLRGTPGKVRFSPRSRTRMGGVRRAGRQAVQQDDSSRHLRSRSWPSRQRASSRRRSRPRYPKHPSAWAVAIGMIHALMGCRSLR